MKKFIISIVSLFLFVPFISAQLALPSEQEQQPSTYPFFNYGNYQQLQNQLQDDATREEARREAARKKDLNDNVPNFHQVSEKLYRGGQPTEHGYELLKQMGIKTVVNLRIDPREESMVKKAGLEYVRIPINPPFLNDKHIEEFLLVMAKKKNWPVFVHCLHGSDRTGAAVASYRVVYQGYTVDNAYAEMLEPKYGFNKIWVHIDSFIRNMSSKQIRDWRLAIQQSKPSDPDVGRLLAANE